jgi:2-dehydro-3-deoxyphosphogluconate aldolase/(4S)-4-hydroxy-2-oxoglutarate aldolase
VDAGARYVVAPGISVAVIERCRERGVPCFPGGATPTDVMQALDHGLGILKFFPAEALGGVTTLRAIAAPFPDVRWVPTGGIGPANLADYLAIPSVVAVGGSWMVRPELIDAGRFDEIERLAAEASALALAAPGAAR